jgi:hypothetical protein
LPSAERTERNVDVTGGNIDMLETSGMSRITRDVAGTFTVPDYPQL